MALSPCNSLASFFPRVLWVLIILADPHRTPNKPREAFPTPSLLGHLLVLSSSRFKRSQGDSHLSFDHPDSMMSGKYLSDSVSDTSGPLYLDQENNSLPFQSALEIQ